MTRRSGIVVRISSERDRSRPALGFFPTERVEAVVRMPKVSPVCGARLPMLGIAPVMGGVIPVVTLGGDRRPLSTPPGAREPPAKVLVVCLLAGERLGIAGLEIMMVGHFDGERDGVRAFGERVADVDLASIAAEINARPWAGRVRA